MPVIAESSVEISRFLRVRRDEAAKGSSLSGPLWPPESRQIFIHFPLKWPCSRHGFVPSSAHQVTGKKLTLFAASVGLAVLLIASYGTRRIWLACLSIVLSAAVVAGVIFVATTETPAEGRAKLAWLAEKLPLVVDRQTLDMVTASLDYILTPAARDNGGPPSVASPSAPPQAMQAASTWSWFGSDSAPKSNANSPVTWLLDDPNAPVVSPIEDGFAIGGVNTSDQALSQVHATLKPDGSRREIPLVLKVEGRAVEGGAVIPAGARFSFGSETPHPADPSAGAILTFRYVVAGQQKAAILYISAATIARFASRE
jgi:hypothetical protein